MCSQLDAHPDTDLDLYHRCKQVLRLKPNEQLVLFDDTHKALATLTEYTKKSVILSLGTKEPLVPLTPEIHWLLPLLKKEAFEQALYSLCEMGAASIYPLKTTKTSRSWGSGGGSEKDYERARTIMRAAAEQSKQFVIPTIHPVGELVSWQAEGQKIFFDSEGKPLKEVLSLSSEGPWYGCVGPEGDLLQEEKEYLKEQGFVFCRLTPTVLRAQQAVALGLGILRSIL